MMKLLFGIRQKAYTGGCHAPRTPIPLLNIKKEDAPWERVRETQSGKKKP